MKSLKMIRYSTDQLNIASEMFNRHAILHILNSEYFVGATSQRKQYRHFETFQLFRLFACADFLT